MANVKMNIAGCNTIRNSPEVQALLLERADAIQARAGSGYTADVQPGKTRAHAMVKTTDLASQKDNAKNNTLLKAMG